jgi:hypothetical protein
VPRAISAEMVLRPENGKEMIIQFGVRACDEPAQARERHAAFLVNCPVRRDIRAGG